MSKKKKGKSTENKIMSMSDYTMSAVFEKWTKLDEDFNRNPDKFDYEYENTFVGNDEAFLGKLKEREERNKVYQKERRAREGKQLYKNDQENRPRFNRYGNFKKDRDVRSFTRRDKEDNR